MYELHVCLLHVYSIDHPGLEKERDFYFEKLREVEILLQDIEESDGPSETTASILKILYATADGFEVCLTVLYLSK